MTGAPSTTGAPSRAAGRPAALATAAVTVMVAGCGPPAGAVARPAADPAPAVHWRGGDAPLSRAADAQLVAIPGGRYVAGSTPEERQAAYDAYHDAAGHDAARAHRWFEVEAPRHVATLPAFRLDLLPVTNAQYAEFVVDGGAPPPTMDERTWGTLGLQQPWTEARRHAWRDGAPPPARADHPVVLVRYDEAAAYCAWRGQVVGAPRRLPSAAEYERAARGAAGAAYPWGDRFDATAGNNLVTGPRDTLPVGSFPAGVSPAGVLDLGGSVFHWTSTPWPPGAPRSAARRTVKGGGWEDWPGVQRGAAGHGRPRSLRHVIVGFRCAADGGEDR